MKYISFLILISLLSISAIAQDINSSIVLDSLVLTIRNVQDETELIPLPETHPNYKEPKVEVTMTFKIVNIEKLKSIEINFERTKGSGDLKTFNLQYAVADGKQYLTIKNRMYEIINATVFITEQVSSQLLYKKIYFSVKALDNESKLSNTLFTEFN